MSGSTLVVSEIRAETPLIRRIRLARPDGAALEPLASGAHLQLTVPVVPDRRCYSVVQLTTAEATDPHPRAYWIAVRREEASRGGSAWMHQLKVGDSITIGEPRNEFPLHSYEPGEAPAVLIAGGIGVTPISSHAAALTAAHRPFVLHYSSRAHDQFAMVPELRALCGDALHLHADDDPQTRMDLDALLALYRPRQHLYVCGPKGMINAAIAKATARGWSKERIHVELFVEAATQLGAAEFEFDVELRQSGKVLHVPANKTILEVLEEAGCDPMYDCRRGECGVCQLGVLEGIPDHRDYYLSEAERASNKLIQVCISRSKTPRLVLDL